MKGLTSYLFTRQQCTGGDDGRHSTMVNQGRKISAGRFSQDKAKTSYYLLHTNMTITVLL